MYLDEIMKKIDKLYNWVNLYNAIEKMLKTKICYYWRPYNLQWSSDATYAFIRKYPVNIKGNSPGTIST